MVKTLAALLLARRWDTLPLASPASIAELFLVAVSVMMLVWKGKVELEVAVMSVNW
jgi:hypothetical protein